MKRSILPALALLALVATNEAKAQVPRVINYQGVLTDLNGKPVIDGNRTVVVKLYDAAVGGNILFSETQTVRFARGVFNVTVGAVTPIPSSLTFDHPYFLGVSVESNPELTPRTAFASAPYAVRSASAAVADSLSSNAKVVTGINGQIGALNVIGSGTVTVTNAGGTMTIAGNGVSSLNGATGDVQIQGTGGTTVTKTGNTLMISSANGGGGGIKGINNLDESIVVLNPTSANPQIGVAEQGITSNKIADGAVTDIKIASVSYSKLTGVPAALPPSGAAGGDLTGNYPNPTIADGVITNNKIANGISYGKLVGAPASLPPSGTAGGDLSGSYPNPTVASNAITTSKIADGAITQSKLDPNISIPTSGAAGGDLTGNYPNPTVANGAISTTKIADGSVTDAKVANGISYSKLSGAPTSLPPSGTAGGDLAGNYPNPTVANNAISTAKIADGAVSTSKVVDGAITDSKIANGISYSKLTGTPTSLPPSGTAGGDLTGNYPNPTVADNAITDSKIANGISYSKLTGAPTSLPPSGTAGGDLSGSYPNPTVADNAITDSKIADGSVTDAKVANGISYSKLTGTPTSLPPSGTAGGDLSGSYPNPTVADNAITDSKIADGSVTDAKVANGISYSKLSGAPTSLSPSGTAGGDLTGNYPNPTVADNAITDSKIASGISYSKLTGAPTSLPPSGTAGGDLSGSYPNPTVADNAISSTKIADGSVTDAKVANGISYSKLTGTPTSLPPSGTAGGDLSGSYPNPTVADNAITDSKIANGISYSKLSGAPTSLPPSGTAGGDLMGNYPNPTVADNAISSTKIADGAVSTSKVVDGAITDSKIADGISYSKLSGAPTSLPPSGTAGGDLTGNYPNPTVADNAITDSKIANGISYSKLSGAPTSLPPSGTAGGDLMGNYPNPTVADNAISSTKLADGSVTDSKIADGISYSKLSGAPTSLPPSGTAGGDLTGNYPNPTVADNAISSTKLADGSVMNSKLADSSVTDAKIASGISYSKLTGTPTSLPPSGTAGGDLTGNYPNPTVADNAISSTKLADGSVTDAKIADGISYSKLSGAPTSLPPSGTAGGDLTGNYPNPTVADNAISSTKITDAAISTSKVADGAITDSKIADGISYSKLSGAPTSLPPSGTAGGDLTGNYPNPTVADNAISSTKLADGSVMNSKLADSSVTDAKIADGISYSKLSGAPTSLPPSGTAGGDLTGSYPNPTVADNAISSTKLADGSVTDSKIADGISYSKLSGAPTSLPPSGTAGGDLTGNYPNPTVADNAISSTKLADGSVTDAKIADGISYSKLSGAPTSLPPSGTASGDLSGSYPNPTVADNAISSTKLADGSVMSSKLADSSVTDSKIADGISYSKLSGAPTSLPPSGTAGGDLTGNYPNPTVADNAITDSKIADGISYSKLSGAPTSLPPSGTAGGDLTGNYPNPTVADNAISSTKLADGSVTDSKIADGISYSKLSGAPTSLPPSGTAGGDLTGNYPNPTVADNAITDAKIADGISYSKLSGAPTSLPPSGTAGGDLTGNYPNPTVADNAISSTKLADGSVTDAKIADGISYSKLSGAPTSLPPSGTAGGDLTGNYPDPTVADNAISSTKLADGSVTSPKLADGSVSTMKVIDSAVTSSKLATGSVATAHIANAAVTTAKIDPTGANPGQALIYDGSNVAWGDVGLALPYSGSIANEGTAFSVTNTDAGRAATFNISNGTNGSNALEASTDGTGYAASFTGSGASSNGVYIQGGVGQTGLELNRGRMVLSYDDGTIAPAGNGGTVTIPDGSVVVVIRAGATTGGFNVNLPNGVVNGQTLTVFNSDANAATVTSGNVLNAGTTINSNVAVEFIWVTTNGGSGWIGK